VGCQLLAISGYLSWSDEPFIGPGYENRYERYFFSLANFFNFKYFSILILIFCDGFFINKRIFLIKLLISFLLNFV
jgi:hypothetical protein